VQRGDPVSRDRQVFKVGTRVLVIGESPGGLGTIMTLPSGALRTYGVLFDRGNYGAAIWIPHIRMRRATVEDEVGADIVRAIGGLA